MQEESIIQKTLFAINNDTAEQKITPEIHDDLSIEDLKKELK